jgi:hypothetical protein
VDSIRGYVDEKIYPWFAIPVQLLIFEPQKDDLFSSTEFTREPHPLRTDEKWVFV